MPGEYSNSEDSVIGVFRTRTEAERAIDALLTSGFDSHRVGVLLLGYDLGGSGTATGGGGPGLVEGRDVGLSEASEVLDRLSSLEVPGFGFVQSSGPIARGLAGGGGGGSTDIVGALAELGVPESEGRRYEEDIRDGNLLVGVMCGDQCDRARYILMNYAAFDVNTFSGKSPSSVERRPEEFS